jgi:hypothetical protein
MLEEDTTTCLKRSANHSVNHTCTATRALNHLNHLREQQLVASHRLWLTVSMRTVRGRQRTVRGEQRPQPEWMGATPLR